MTGNISRALTVENPSRDIAVERLEAVIQSANVGQLLTDRWPTPNGRCFEVVYCDLVHLFMRGRHEFVLEYEVGLRDSGGERTQRIFGEIAADDPGERYRRAAIHLARSRPPPLEDEAEMILCLDELSMVLRTPGLDDCLRGLELTRNPNVMHPAIEKHLLTDDRPIECVTSEILGHRLGKRRTVRLKYARSGEEGGTAPQGSLIAKMYARNRDRGRIVLEAMQRLQARGFDSDASIRIPQPYAYLPKWQTILMEDVPGRLLWELSGAALNRGLATCGRTIAKLHRCDLEIDHRHTVDDEIELIERWVGLTARLHAGMGEATGRGLRAVRNELLAIRDAPTALVHRDFYDKQVLIDGSRSVLIDFDTLAMSDPAIDLGNFLAHIQLARFKGLTLGSDAEAQFLSAYGPTPDSEFEARIDVYRRATLLRLSCLYAFRPRWSQVVEMLLEEVSGETTSSGDAAPRRLEGATRTRGRQG